ncbi:MAG: double-strand break repair helicase AddA [Pseudomonadota bacterium]
MAECDLGSQATEEPLPISATPAQRRSSDPDYSVWVTANAGTGKTRILVDRVLRLLLAGNAPDGLLCLTFTKSAAAEMRGRVEARLSAWATQSDNDVLIDEIKQLTGNTASSASVDLARRLFGVVMDLPDGLQIMTIHAFCQSVLRRFPLEADVAPHFEVMDDRTTAELLQSARDAMIASAQAGDKALSEALTTLAVAVTEQTITETLAEAMAEKRRISDLIRRYGCIVAVGSAVCDLLDTPSHLSIDRLTSELCANGVFDVEGLIHAANDLTTDGNESEQAIGRDILAWLNAASEDRRILLEQYLSLFVTKGHQARARLVTKAFLEKHDQAVNALRREQARIVRFAQTRTRVTTARRTLALLRFSHAVIDAYETEKRRRAALDFDDLIASTRRLLSQPGAAQWVLFKLDARIDHILIDEAQDTSPDQWEIIEQLLAEFHVGESARVTNRTLFVVGDDKQSIYSFRGADLETFQALRRRIIGSFEAARRPIRPELLDLSFRSTGVILDVVDRVFAMPEARQGVVAEEEEIRHFSARRNEPSLVEVWPLMEHQPNVQTPSWPLPTDRRTPQEPERDLAEAIVRKIRQWLDNNRHLPSAGRSVMAGDILILLSRRGRLQEFLVRAFKREDVPVAGADRLNLLDHIAIQDLIALGQAVLLPEDDLNFAALLKSPLFGFEEDQLFDIAWNREDATIWSRLRDLAKVSPPFYADAVAKFEGWQRRADFMPPFEFYAHILGPDGQRKRLVERLGPDALEPIEAFLAQALIYEDGHPSSLQGFLHWLQLESQTLKRDTDAGHDQVRIMTVHGAKGLEAPIVFLADAAAEAPTHSSRMLWHGPSGLALWRSRSEERSKVEEECVETVRVKQEKERHRLLYVAMTRARDELYVCGCASRRHSKRATSTWYEHITRGLETHDLLEKPEIALCPGTFAPGLRVERRGSGSDTIISEDKSTKVVARAMPDWATCNADTEEKTAPIRLIPSKSEPPQPAGSFGADMEARQIGSTIHRLLEYLPKIERNRRQFAIQQYFRTKHPDLARGRVEAIEANILQILEGQETASLFGPGSFSEQPIAGIVGGVAISGQIDRMTIEDNQITFVDYKTNVSPPQDTTLVPSQYLRQMATYYLLVAKIYPQKSVLAGILWTSIPRLDFLDQEQLKHYMPRTLESECV